MLRELRRKDRAITHGEAKVLLARGEYGVLSTVSADGSPYGVPINYCILDDMIYFHSAPEGHKLDNIAADSKVSFCVVGATRVLPDKFATLYESVIVSGKAEEVFDAEKQMALEGLVAKYSGGFREEGLRFIFTRINDARVFRIVIAAISGKACR
jgi:nitroimidazol reductase NimA-like FMN-containing flavoprotein (pyridoxamine 5'-phosphate oxidase superfamily)